ncbi:MAG: glutathione peroxidase [Deltaproteobacteria bacterium]|nr:glutathione peroxidase [Deltaproteobacteria bacterium]
MGDSNTAHDFSLTTIAGANKPLADYQGKVLLVVNLASRCGYTPQYRGLEALHRKLKDKGLVVVGVPCNQFGAQEPGTDAEIHAFCTSKYEVSFDLFSKVDVNGDAAAPLFRWLTTEGKGPIKWNFAKFIVGRDGKYVTRFDSGTAPESKELNSALEKALG